jgi:protein-S-isoprenylcysteine O-methyltransferase Ste14
MVTPREPVAAFKSAAVALKVASWTLVAVNLDVDPTLALYVAWWPVYACAVALVLFGQLLNYRVYELLGVEGVYYGTRFGKQIAWVTAWPYSWINNPQYVGCILTLVGGALFLPFIATLNGIASYVYLCYLERREPPLDPDTSSRFEELLLRNFRKFDWSPVDEEGNNNNNNNNNNNELQDARIFIAQTETPSFGRTACASTTTTRY